MYRYIIKRILMMIPVLLGVTFVIFSMMYISEGDPARMILGEGAQEAEVEALREELGLNDPFLTRYVNYIKGIVTKGDLGTSYVTGRSVSEEIFDRWPTTMLLAVLSVLLATAIGIPACVVRVNGSKVARSSEELNQRDYPDMVHADIKALQQRIAALECALADPQAAPAEKR